MIKTIHKITPLILILTQLSAQIVTVQGVLRDNNNAAISDGTYEMTFEIFDSQSGGTSLWSTVGEDVTVINGVYSLGLNIGTSLQSSGSELWLEVTVNGDTMNERVRLHISPYEQMIIEGQSNVFPGSGNVGIGTTDPSAKLDVRGNINIHGVGGDGLSTLQIGHENQYLDISSHHVSGSHQYSEIKTNYGTDLLLNPDGGDVGIGTASPGATLDVNGSLRATSTDFNNSIDKNDLAPGAEAFSNWTLESETFDDLTYEWNGSGWRHYYKGLSCTDDGGFIVIKASNDPVANPGTCFSVSIYDTWGAGHGYVYITGGQTCEDQELNFSLPCIKGKSMKINFSKYGSDANGDEQARVVLYTY